MALELLKVGDRVRAINGGGYGSIDVVDHEMEVYVVDHEEGDPANLQGIGAGRPGLTRPKEHSPRGWLYFFREELVKVEAGSN